MRGRFVAPVEGRYPTIDQIIKVYKDEYGKDWQRMLLHELFLIHGSQVLGIHSSEQDHWYGLLRIWVLDRIIEVTGGTDGNKLT